MWFHPTHATSLPTCYRRRALQNLEQVAGSELCLRLLVKKCKKDTSAAGTLLLSKTQMDYSKSLDKAFAALRVKYNTQSAHFTHEQHALEDKAAGISEQLATYVS